VSLFKHGLHFDEPNLWDICGELWHQPGVWETGWDTDHETLIEGGWWLHIMPWQLDEEAILLWGTHSVYGEPMGILGGQKEYKRKEAK
tara:strand:+ start:953 stop:1216 length:264 start_codon:yes stop_codon:yes gene_type:complete